MRRFHGLPGTLIHIPTHPPDPSLGQVQGLGLGQGLGQVLGMLGRHVPLHTP